MEETILNELKDIISRHDIKMPSVSEKPMTKEEYNNLVNKWDLSAGLLTKLLCKSIETIRSYRSRRNYPIPLDVAIKLRKIDIIFTDFSNLWRLEPKRKQPWKDIFATERKENKSKWTLGEKSSLCSTLLMITHIK